MRYIQSRKNRTGVGLPSDEEIRLGSEVDPDASTVYTLAVVRRVRSAILLWMWEDGLYGLNALAGDE